MKRIVLAIAILFLGGCSATSPQYASQRKAEILAKAETTCSHADAPKRIACLNRVVHQTGYWGQGVIVVAGNDGSPRLVDNYRSRDGQYNVGGDMYNSGANPSSAR